MSTKALKSEDNRVIDVVYSLGSKGDDGYQRAFNREFGCSPKAQTILESKGVIEGRIHRFYIVAKKRNRSFCLDYLFIHIWCYGLYINIQGKAH